MFDKRIIPSSFLFLFIFAIGCVRYNSSKIQNNKVEIQICDTVPFDYNKNDTSKVVFVSGVAFDTTACAIQGYILDRSTLKPIPKAIIHLNDGFILHAAKTDNRGYFSIFNEIVCKANNWELSIYHNKYTCMKIGYTQKNGGVNLKIKLSKK